MKYLLFLGIPALPVRALCLLVIGVGPALLVSCGQKPSAKTPINPEAVAEIGDRTISVEEFKKELALRARPPAHIDANTKRALLEEMMRFQALYQRAMEKGYDQHPEVTASFKRMVVAKFQEDQLQKAEDITVSPEDIQAYYEANPSRFGTPETRRGALLFIRVPDHAPAEKKVELLTRIHALRQAALTNEVGSFGALAVNHSEDQATRYQGGDMGWFKADVANPRWERPVMDALFALKRPGEISPAVTTAKGHYLVKWVETKAAAMRPLAEVKEGVQYLLLQQKQKQMQDEFIEAQKAGLRIQINQAALDAIPLPDVTIAAKVRPRKHPPFKAELGIL